MSEDDTSDLEELKIDRQLGRQADRQQGDGARIEMKDRRMSSLLHWFWGFVAMAAVSGIYWVASSITNLNTNLEKALLRLDYQDKRTDLNEAQIRQLQRDVAEMRGKVYRGDGTIGGELSE